ncbi:UvrD-helicase domain-containing protein [Acidovorax sp. NCPPB 3576]|uniref:UvrD-helicase domain-containing protein n=1 Tax=Acidovorax sp. NCPPB 3576 TaxID=2940488 RepID=UPI00234A577E|nr:UvrD-helicase domain-containing protein [Acidovorax sp. NCPPB 3576]WCM90609.1 UvrD-helicase domain-containing protein [Acidovorax sp. NCPPB 3576]
MSTAPLVDAPARVAALSAHDRTLLVEAGAGSGKTAVLAGRIAMMLLAGIEPKSIAAVTFTELAASELLLRVRQFVNRLLEGEIPLELRLVLPAGVSDSQRAALQHAQSHIDDVTCSTIHGFCQRLIRPYPVEANIDPGASIMDPDQEKLAFHDVVEQWLRERLDGGAHGLLAELMLADPEKTIEMVNQILGHLKAHEDLQAPAAPPLADLVAVYQSASASYSDLLHGAGFAEQETAEAAAAWQDMAQGLNQWDITTSAGQVGLVQSKAHESLCTKTGFKAYSKKGKWVAAAAAAGRSKAEGECLAGVALTLHQNCCGAWDALVAGAAAHVLRELLPILRPAIARMQEYKRSAALMDFDDLLRSARSLLRLHDDVRVALAQKYRHVLVDEFQDTDPVQTEIFWRLCGDPTNGADNADWRSFRIRPGALFLVGDPKQAIYRFRGADVRAYVEARETLRAQDAESVSSIAVNFRSCGPILEHVNQRFAVPLGQPDQPGFIPLEVFHPARDEGPSVAALDVAAANENGKATADQIRDAEAEAVARLCAHLIGRESIKDPDTGIRRPCQPGDIALLAPTGAQLWRYEQALEDHGIPVATQAGKGFFRRQEIQDLIAVTRVLADSRDTLAVGTLFRGPVVGLTEEELLDVLWGLRDAETGRPASLSPSLDASRVAHALAKHVLLTLQGLRLKARSTTPHDLLAQAVDELRIRPILMQRSGRQAERALANVDLFLNLSRAYDIRGLAAFADAMRGAWEDEARAVEGRPDAQEESVALYSMHAAKGLEWPVVVPINGATTVMPPSRDVVTRATSTLYCPILGVAPTGHEGALEAEKLELQRERIRLWYVAATRARELMVIPRVDAQLPSNAWSALIDLGVAGLPPLEVPEDAQPAFAAEAEEPNTQTPEVFNEEAARIAATSHPIVWKIPSREEDLTRPLEQEETPEVYIATADGSPETATAGVIQGGRERGLVLHKLLEEVLTGEVSEAAEALSARAAELAEMLGAHISDDSAGGMSPIELATSTLRALSLDVIAALRPTLVPEFHVYSSTQEEGKEHVRTGIIDAIAYSSEGTPTAVVDWKSDVEPTADTIAHYKAQVRSYLTMTGTPIGYVVFATTGAVHEVVPSK